jgi:hypothetical protein
MLKTENERGLTMDADTLESSQLERRRQMAIDRRRRESDRLSLLAKLVDGKHRADELRNWIDAFVPVVAEGSRPELQRMLAWAQAHLAELEAFLDAPQMTALIGERDLFPEIDQFHDPLGEPPPRRIWSGCW